MEALISHLELLVSLRFVIFEDRVVLIFLNRVSTSEVRIESAVGGERQSEGDEEEDQGVEGSLRDGVSGSVAVETVGVGVVQVHAGDPETRQVEERADADPRVVQQSAGPASSGDGCGEQQAEREADHRESESILFSVAVQRRDEGENEDREADVEQLSASARHATQDAFVLQVCLQTQTDETGGVCSVFFDLGEEVRLRVAGWPFSSVAVPVVASHLLDFAIPPSKELLLQATDFDRFEYRSELLIRRPSLCNHRVSDWQVARPLACETVLFRITPVLAPKLIFRSG